MKPVFQIKVDKDKGDCMQAVIASLFEKSIDEVPAFIEFGEKWFSELYTFLRNNGYDYEGMIHNKIYQKILLPNHSCFKKTKYHLPSLITKSKLQKESGINGYFFASVLSPKYVKSILDEHTTHAVVIDGDYNIVHDPNSEYAKILQYPLADIIGYNGIIDVYLINKI
jgi:hypothetical protein